jgi:hypothetical protein
MSRKDSSLGLDLTVCDYDKLELGCYIRHLLLHLYWFKRNADSIYRCPQEATVHPQVAMTPRHYSDSKLDILSVSVRWPSVYPTAFRSSTQP